MGYLPLIAKLYQSPKTILTTKDLALLWEETNSINLKSKIGYYAKQGALIRRTRGVFAKDKNYNPKELATSIYAPSYISFETVLREAGMIFQRLKTLDYGAITHNPPTDSGGGILRLRRTWQNPQPAL